MTKDYDGRDAQAAREKELSRPYGAVGGAYSGAAHVLPLIAPVADVDARSGATRGRRRAV